MATYGLPTKQQRSTAAKWSTALNVVCERSSTLKPYVVGRQKWWNRWFGVAVVCGSGGRKSVTQQRKRVLRREDSSRDVRLLATRRQGDQSVVVRRQHMGVIFGSHVEYGSMPRDLAATYNVPVNSLLFLLFHRVVLVTHKHFGGTESPNSNTARRN